MPRPAHYETPTCASRSSIVGPFENNVFVVRCKGTGDAVIIDAANEHELLLEVSKATGVRRVLTTHGHWDHIQAVEAVRDAGIDVGIAADDASMLPGLRLRDPRRRGDRGRRPAPAHDPQPRPHRRAPRRSCSRGTPSSSAATRCSPAVPATPRFAGGDFAQIIESIDRRLFTLPADLLVLPGHGLDTTIGTERPHLQEWVDRGGWLTSHRCFAANDDCWCGSGKKYKRCHKAALVHAGAVGPERAVPDDIARPDYATPGAPVRTTESAVKSPDVIERMRVRVPHRARRAAGDRRGRGAGDHDRRARPRRARGAPRAAASTRARSATGASPSRCARRSTR